MLSDRDDGSWPLFSAGMEVSGMESSRLAKASTVYSSMATHPISFHNQCESCSISFGELDMSTATCWRRSTTRASIMCLRRGCGEPTDGGGRRSTTSSAIPTIYGLNVSSGEPSDRWEHQDKLIMMNWLRK